MAVSIDIIIDYLRLFVINMSVYYCFSKIGNKKQNYLKNSIILIIVNAILIFIFMPIKNKYNSIIVFGLFCFIYTTILSAITKLKLGSSIIITLISYAITFVANTIGIVIQFFPYKLMEDKMGDEILLLSLFVIALIQILLIYGLFKIKRLKNGFSFLNNKLNNEITDIIVINTSIMIIIVYCLFIIYEEQIAINLFMTFLLSTITMFFTIKKMFTMYYKQKLLIDTMEEYKQELKEKQDEIENLKTEKRNISKITHEFYNRQKALELLVGSKMEIGTIDTEGVSNTVLKMIESLTCEYSSRFEEIKDLPKLDGTDIPEIDNMFKYMQMECSKSNIDFKLKVAGNIHSLVNNIIPKNKLETLIGDHLRDAINAVNLSSQENKEILAVIGIKDKKYEFSVFDTGIDFTVDTLLKLGLMPVTTNEMRGGTGTGFMTTFETMKETKASLVITEYPPSAERHFTKCVSIVFDGKNQYVIDSYRIDEIKNEMKDKRIKLLNKVEN